MYAILLALAALLIAVLGWLVLPWRFEAAPVGGDGDPERGAYVLRMGGCVTCHTNGEDGPFLAGGRRLETPFGTFYTSNITPDPETGIGGWSAADFILALTEGVAPEGHPYYPAFPYTSYTRMTEQDLLDLKAYLDTVEPVSNRVPAHDLGLAASFRFPLRVWQALYLDEDGFRRRPDRDELWNRGAYLVNGPGHCSECHTPRNVLGGPRTDRWLAGTPNPTGDGTIPNITPAKLTWTEQQISNRTYKGRVRSSRLCASHADA